MAASKSDYKIFLAMDRAEAFAKGIDTVDAWDRAHGAVFAAEVAMNRLRRQAPKPSPQQARAELARQRLELLERRRPPAPPSRAELRQRVEALKAKGGRW